MIIVLKTRKNTLTILRAQVLECRHPEPLHTVQFLSSASSNLRREHPRTRAFSYAYVATSGHVTS